ncbi:hypothetical protein [Lysinibacillus xylanilyticus]|uniref:hypothetical protein n=1 Tax=Lysinibacillus xylanilyticus TaxID=582475 RepID=UPI0037F11159
MGRFLTIEELRERIKQLDEKKEARDIEQGYCKMPAPIVSDTWAYEAYKKHLPEIHSFLAEYAELLLLSKKGVVVGESDKLKEWRKLLDVASFCNEQVLGAKCTFITNVYLKEAIEGGCFSRSGKYAELADMIVRTVSDYPYSLYLREHFTDDYDGDFDAYYKQKQEELRIWREN